MSTARDLCRQHGSPYIRPSARRERAEGWACAVLLAACLTVPAALIDTEEPDDMQPNLNAPAIDAGPLTAEELAAYNRARVQAAWDMPGTSPQAAECCTEIGAGDDDGEPVSDLVTAAVLILSLAGSALLVAALRGGLSLLS